jgi:acetyl-CoA carboxylase biotin carboxyl carrier protein
MSDETTTGGADQELLRSVWKEARDLIERLEGSTVQRFRVEAGNTAIEIERGVPAGGAQSFTLPPAALAAGGETEADAARDGRIPVLAPLVGTFYRAAQPGAKPYVEEGDVVDASQTVAIVEAMKIMNQVPAGTEGRVAEIVASDGDWVEFEQVIMYLEPMDE